jgi:hypothetical protein
MLWEIWGRRKVNFAFDAAALLASLLCVHWMQHGLGDITRAVLILVLVSCFLGSHLDLLTCFGFIEINAQKVQSGYPGRLLLKPVSTLKLVLVPMLFGGAAVVAILLTWNELVLQPLKPAGAFDSLWLGAVVLSFFWWMQALAWSFPLLPGRSLVIVMVAVFHLLLGLLPLAPTFFLSGWRWPILVALLVSAVLVAWIGVKLMRQGRWEGPSPMARFWSRLGSAWARGRRKKFRSAFGAQFWLEWHRQGWLLPSLSGGIVFVMLPLIFVVNHQLEAAASGANFILIAATLTLTVPIMLSSVMGINIAQFDRLLPAGEPPIYIAIRPMTNGGFVIAKLAMALVSSILTWLVILSLGGFWLVLLEKDALIAKIPRGSPYELLAIVMGCVPLLLVLILFTWKNMIGGMGAGLTGRRWLATLFSFSKTAGIIGLAALVTALKLNDHFKELLLHWLTALLCLGLAGKILLSTAAFMVGIRRHAITIGVVAWIVGGWWIGGLFVASYAGLVCHAMHHSELWLWIALAGFQMLPLAELAIAPLALAWNRHR